MQKEEKVGQNDLRDRTKKFALRMIKMYSALPKTTAAQVLGATVSRKLRKLDIGWNFWLKAELSINSGWKV